MNNHEDVLSNIFKLGTQYMLIDILKLAKDDYKLQKYLNIDFIKYIIDKYVTDINFIDDREKNKDYNALELVIDIDKINTNSEIYKLFIDKGIIDPIYKGLYKGNYKNQVAVLKSMFKAGAKISDRNFNDFIRFSNNYSSEAEILYRIEIIEVLLRHGAHISKGTINMLKYSKKSFVSKFFELLRKIINKKYINAEDVEMMYRTLPREYKQQYSEVSHDIATIVIKNQIKNDRKKRSEIMKKIDLIEDYVLNNQPRPEREQISSFNSRDFNASHTVSIS